MKNIGTQIKSKKLIFFILFTLFIIPLFYIFKNHNLKQVTIPTKRSQQNTSIITHPLRNGTVLLYKSELLNIQFHYLSVTDNGMKVLTKEINNKIFIYIEGQNYLEGQSVEILPKLPDDSLQTSLEKIIVQSGDTLSDCEISSTIPAISLIQKGYSFASIIYSKSNGGGLGVPHSAIHNRCPDKFLWDSKVIYFETNDTVKSKLVLINLSSSNSEIFRTSNNPSDTNEWNETINIY